MALTPEQIKQYYATEGQKASPLSPLAWLAQQPAQTAPAPTPAPAPAQQPQMEAMSAQVQQMTQQATQIGQQMDVLTQAKAAGMAVTPQTTVTQAQQFLTPSPPPAPAPDLTPIKDTTPITTQDPTPALPAQPDYDAYFGSLVQEVAQSRIAVENIYQKQIDTLRTQQEASQKRIDEYTAKTEATLEEVKQVTSPWQADLEKSERERLLVEENYFANQQSIGELEQLLNKAMEDIRTAESVTGLGSIRYPRIAQVKEDYQARVGIVEAVMAARNNQISVANNLIDRTATAIANDKNSQLTYYNAILGFYDKLTDQEGNRLINLEAQEKTYINAQIGLLENDLAQAQASANYIKQLMLDPSTAKMMEASGVKVTDTPQQIQSKFAEYGYSEELREFSNNALAQGLTRITAQQATTLPAGQVLTQTDSRGNVSHWQVPMEAVTPDWQLRTIGRDLVRVDPQTGAMEVLATGPEATPASYREWQLAGSPGEYADWMKKTGVSETTLPPPLEIPSFEEFLAEAEKAQQMSFPTYIREELRKAYDEEFELQKAQYERQLAGFRAEMSPLAMQIVERPEILNSLTPTERTKMLQELAKYGYEVPIIEGVSPGGATIPNLYSLEY